MKSLVMLGAVSGFALGLATLDPARTARRQPQAAPARQETPPAPKQEDPAAKPPPAKASLLVPFFGNEKCPVDAKPVDRELWLDVEGQRIYACTAACLTTLKVDPAKSLKQAYPDVKAIPTRGCATCGAALEAGKSVDMTFQGRSFKLCSAACQQEFQAHPGVWLAHFSWPEVKDAGNRVCPIDAKPIDGVTVVIWKGTLVRLSAQKCVAEFEKDPDGAIAKLKTGG